MLLWVWVWVLPVGELRWERMLWLRAWWWWDLLKVVPVVLPLVGRWEGWWLRSQRSQAVFWAPMEGVERWARKEVASRSRLGARVAWERVRVKRRRRGKGRRCVL